MIRLPYEAVADITVNGSFLASLHCSPGELDELAYGFLVSEGILKDPAALKGLVVEGTRICAQIEGVDTSRLRLSLVSGCGRGVSIGSLDELMDCASKINLGFTVKLAELRQLVKDFARHSILERESRGLHFAALAAASPAPSSGQFPFTAQDIGRHNAIDRVVGKCLLSGGDPCSMVLFTSGRLSLDMVAKAIRCGIPIAVALSVPTKGAVDLAARFHLCIVGSGKGAKPIIYSGLMRIEGAGAEECGDGGVAQEE